MSLNNRLLAQRHLLSHSPTDTHTYRVTGEIYRRCFITLSSSFSSLRRRVVFRMSACVCVCEYVCCSVPKSVLKHLHPCVSADKDVGGTKKRGIGEAKYAIVQS